eukprot:Nk52_evm15s327 gene=Nk52_evmTU15s327
MSKKFANLGGGPKCPRCVKTVYMAEEMLAAGKKWHKRCFTCKECNRGLDSSTCTDREEEIYCKPCHSKLYGPKGYGYGQGGGVLQTGVYANRETQKEEKEEEKEEKKEEEKEEEEEREEEKKEEEKEGKEVKEVNHAKEDSTPTSSRVRRYSNSEIHGPQTIGTIEISPGGYKPKRRTSFGKEAMVSSSIASDVCPRCSKVAYAAEKVVGAGKSWHRACFRCSSCRKTLDSTTVSDREGDIFCKGCYGKNFGPKGYGYGQGAGALQHTQ